MQANTGARRAPVLGQDPAVRLGGDLASARAEPIDAAQLATLLGSQKAAPGPAALGGTGAHLIGSGGDDILTGTASADTIESGWGDDVVDGGDGDDFIVDSGGNNVVHGGGGNDFIRLYNQSQASFTAQLVRANNVDAGDGNDVVRIDLDSYHRLDLDLGAGSDLVTLTAKYTVFDNQVRITTGAGPDRIVLTYEYGAVVYAEAGPVVVTDFTAGIGGDIIDIVGLLKGKLTFNAVGPNPFADGHLRLVQDGADVIVRVDLDGNGPASGGFYRFDVVRLENVSVASLTAYNFAGFSPSGAAPTHGIVNGSAAGEWLNANAGGSDLFGLDGDDRLTGGIYDDLLEGGAGSDIIDGGRGNDILRGGDGDDVLNDGFGNDLFEGGAGNDTIDVIRPSIMEPPTPLTDQIRIDAGDGDDFVRFEIQKDPWLTYIRRAALTIDLGAGNDRVELPYIVPGTLLSLGAGQDRVVLGEGYLRERGYGDVPGLVPLTITDFAAGNGGDVLELDRAILVSAWNRVSNPFAGGYLLLQQSGADTLVVMDFDGAGGSSSSLTLARLANVNAASLTAFNFAGYAPGGAASSYTVPAGTAQDDTIYGSSGADAINGAGGNDRIVDLKAGADTLSGGDGDDIIIVSHYSSVEAITIDAGADNDIVEVLGSFQRVDVNLGGGNDRLRFYAYGEAGAFLTLGAGADVVILDEALVSSIRGPMTITDFATGNGGDRLDWSFFAESFFLNWYWIYDDPRYDPTDYNPFLTGDARLIQSGADTLLQVQPGQQVINPDNYLTLLTFRNTVATSFTADNLGYASYAPTQDGGAGNDTLTGTGGADVLVGEAGDDHLDGLGGADVLRGYDGTDVLIGGAGNDRLEGGRGADSLTGGDDADYLDGGSGRDTVDGGAGNDVIRDYFGTDTIVAGAGDDLITLAVATDYTAGGNDPLGSLDAGDGNDIVYVNAGNDDYLVNLGAGDDYVRVYTPVDLVLGPGRDTIVYAAPSLLNPTLVLTDFTTGDGGDIFDLHASLAGPLRFSPGLQAVEGGTNPFALGYTELRQVGSDVELIVFPEGNDDSSVYTYTALVRFANTTIAQLTAANFGGWDPHAVPNRPTVVTGNLTIAAGQTVDSLNITPFSGWSGPIGGHFLFRNQTGAADFVNHGTVTSRQTAAGIVGGFIVDSFSYGGSFVNAADGRFIVQSTFQEQSGDIQAGGATGFDAGAHPIGFRNDGYYEVSSAGGTALGLLAGFDMQRQPIVNTGTFVVTSGFEAIGFDIGWGAPVSNSGSVTVTGQQAIGLEIIGEAVSFTNSGSVTVTGQDVIGVAIGGEASSFSNSGSVTATGLYTAIGVYLVDFRGGSSFYNGGSIIAATNSKSPYASVGVFATHVFGGPYVYTNAGTITADIAFLSDDSNYPTLTNADQLINTGQMHGDIRLGHGTDSLTNSGVISGNIELGDGFDSYDGSAGFLTGIVDGGTHDDVLLGGTNGETLIGGTGSDKLYGGGGDDLLLGGRGSDALDGSTGFDLISFVDSWAPVSVDFASGQASGSGNDRFRSVEGAIGSAYGDTLSGAAAGEFLEGAGGDDIISGGGGADVILGDTGDDLLTGGAGADIFAVSIGDGDDIVTDFNPIEDKLQIHGYAAADEIRQVGADTLVILSASQSVLLRNVQASSLTGAQLIFDPVPLGPDPAAVVISPGTQVAFEGFSLYAGETARIVDPAAVFAAEVLVRHTGVDLLSYEGSSLATIGGSFTLEVTANSGIAKGFFVPSVVNLLATGTIDVLTSGAVSAVGVYAGALLSAGHLRVISTNSAAPVLDDDDIHFTRPEVAASSAIGVFCDNPDDTFINNGTIEVSSGRMSSGVLSYNNDVDGAFWNSGDILVTGGLASIGVLFHGFGHPAIAQRPTFVNSGDIVVTDATPLADSVGLALSFSSVDGGGLGVNVWNSGLIQADYAIRWRVISTPDFGGPANIYNSGELRGLVELSDGSESLYNRGLITGRIELGQGNDLFDGRGGVQAGGIFGGYGNDTLFGGAGAEQIDGGAGDDLLAGGGGSDVLTGGAGNDIFHVEAGFGADTIVDFTAGTGEDSIRVSGYGSYQSVQQQGADTLVTFSATDTILLRNVAAASLTAQDFVFSAAALAAAGLPAAPAQPVPTDYSFTPSGPPAFAVAPSIVLNGTSGGDTLSGGDGNDILSGGGGDDFIEGGIGSDRIEGGAGADDLYGGSGADTFVFRAAAESVAAGEDWIYDFETGSDRIDLTTINITSLGWTQQSDVFGIYQAVTIGTTAGTMSLRVYGQLATGDFIISAFTLTGTPGPDNLSATTGNVSLFGLGGADQLSSGAGNDYLDGGTGADTMSGGGGTDIYLVDNGGDRVIEAAGGGRDVVYASISYTLAAGSEIEILSTISQSATTPLELIGNEFANEIYGNAGSNFLDGGGGVDFLMGFGGGDVYIVDSGGDVIAEAIGGGRDVVYARASYVLTAGAEVEVLSVISQAAGVVIDLTGNELANELYGNTEGNFLDGGGGVDYLMGFTGNDRYVVDTPGDVVAENIGEGRDVVYAKADYTLGAGTEIEVLSALSTAGTNPLQLIGNGFANEIYGNAGVNFLDGGGGVDFLMGFGGDDVYIVDSGGDTVAEAAGGGRDVVYARASYVLTAGAEVEVLSVISQAAGVVIDLTGNELANELYGNTESNFLDGGGGVDYLMGFSGNDSYVVDNLADVVAESAGGGRDVVFARSSYVLAAGVEVEVLSTISQGATTAIDLTGNNLANELYGNAGTNVLNGGAGGDYMLGFGGADTFAFTTALGGGNVDQIGDFVSGTDRIALDDAIFTGLALGALGANAFVAGTQAGDADDRIIYNSATGQLFFDADGNGSGAAILFATLASHPPLVASDFTVI